jgi:1-acyl-sn-glycerol-3-phosphate acyltransferase
MKEDITNSKVKLINIREIFAAKSPGLARLIPGFVYRFLHRILHLDFMNEILVKYGHLEGTKFVESVVEMFNVHEHLHGLENIPKKGKFIFASNHPLGGFDGMLLMKAVENQLGEFKFLANDILLNIPQLKPVFVPVNKHGGHAREAARRLSEVYDSDAQVLIFPYGLASRKVKGKITDLEWKKHFITKAVQHKRDIIPVFISGRNTNRFYRLAKFRKFFRIKWNLEMFLLPDETYHHQNMDVHLYFGKPISHTTFDSSKSHSQWAAWVKEQVYKLPVKKKQ